MKNYDFWRQQDVLQLSVNAWEEVLKDPTIFDNNALRMIRFVYHQDNCQSTATAIARALSTPNRQLHYNSICAYNRKVAKALYERFQKQPPPNTRGGSRFWNLLFDGVPETPTDENGHFYWRLRPNLVIAMGNLFE